MGYNTRFSGQVKGHKQFLGAFKDAATTLDERYTYPPNEVDWLDGDDFFGGEPSKWYDWQEDVKAMSARYPYLTFVLEGEGEEAGDLWKAWFRNGKSVSVDAVITFPEPDLDKELPMPDLDVALAEVKAARVDALQKQINALTSQIDEVKNS